MNLHDGRARLRHRRNVRAYGERDALQHGARQFGASVAQGQATKATTQRGIEPLTVRNVGQKDQAARAGWRALRSLLAGSKRWRLPWSGKQRGQPCERRAARIEAELGTPPVRDNMAIVGDAHISQRMAY